MKKMYLGLLTVLAISSLTTSIKAMEITNPPVFLVNNYGGAISYKLGSSTGSILGNGAKSVALGTVRDLSNTGLFIGSSRYMGMWHSLADKLQECKNIPIDGRYYDAIITVNPSYGAWDINVSFEPRGEKVNINYPVNKTLPNIKVLPTKKQAVK
jgi:hypothetical protein